MNLDDAINLSKVADEDMNLQDMPRFAEAVSLGREAMKRLKRLGSPEPPFATPYELLPGETLTG